MIKINRLCLEVILNNEEINKLRSDALACLCNWRDTPQGFTYWCNEAYNLNEDKELSHEALMYLTVLYDQSLLDHENVITETNSTIDLAT